MKRLYTLIKKLGTAVAGLSAEKKLFAWSCLILGVLFFVPSNSVLLLVACVCVAGLFSVWNNLTLTVLYTYLLFLPFATGKSLSFLLVPETYFYRNIPFTVTVSVSISNFMCAVLLYIYFRNRFVSKNRSPSVRLGFADIMLSIFFLATMIASAFSNIPLLSFLLTAQLTSYIFVYYFIRAHRLKRWLLDVFLPLTASLCTFEGLWSVLQLAHNSPLGKPIEGTLSPVLHAASENTSFFRMQGTFDDPNYLGFFMAVFTPWLLYFSMSKRTSYFGKIISAIGVMAGIAGLILSGSRFSWLFFAVAAFLLLRVKIIRSSLDIIPSVKRLYLTFICACMIAIPLYVIPRLSQLVTTFDAGGGLQFRWFLLEKSFEVIVQHPLGIGLGLFPNVLLDFIGWYTFPPTEPHNLIAQIFVASGVVGGSAFIGFLYVTIKNSLVESHTNPAYRTIMRSLGIISLGVFLTLTMAYPVLIEQSIFPWLWILFSVVT